jgi:hypothetical protein
MRVLLDKPCRDRLTVCKESDPTPSPFGLVLPFVGGHRASYSVRFPVSVLAVPQTPEERERLEALGEGLRATYGRLLSSAPDAQRCSTISNIWPLAGGLVVEDQGIWAPTLRAVMASGAPPEVVATVVGEVGRLLSEASRASGQQHGFLCAETILVSTSDGRPLLSDWQIPASLSPRRYLSAHAGRRGDQPWPDADALRHLAEPGGAPPTPAAIELVLRHARSAVIWPEDHPVP